MNLELRIVPSIADDPGLRPRDLERARVALAAAPRDLDPDLVPGGGR